jgi:hypothetical protein
MTIHHMDSLILSTCECSAVFCKDSDCGIPLLLLPSVWPLSLPLLMVFPMNGVIFLALPVCPMHRIDRISSRTFIENEKCPCNSVVFQTCRRCELQETILPGFKSSLWISPPKPWMGRKLHLLWIDPCHLPIPLYWIPPSSQGKNHKENLYPSSNMISPVLEGRVGVLSDGWLCI